MNFLYRKLIKIHESNKGRNQRADKRVSVDIEEKKVIRAEMDTKVERISREQRMLERELDRIRQGGYKRPVETDTVELRKNVSPARLSKPLHVSVVTSPTPIRLTIHDLNANTPQQRNILELIPRQQESARSSRRQHSFSRSPFRKTPNHPMHIDVRASPAFRHAFQQYMDYQSPRLPPLTEYETQETASRTLTSLRAEGNAIDVIPDVMKASADFKTRAISSEDNPPLQSEINPSKIRSSRSEENNQYSFERNHNLRKPFDVVQLSSIDIQNVRGNISKRLSKNPADADGIQSPSSKKIPQKKKSMRLSREKNRSLSVGLESQIAQDRRKLSVIGEKAIGDSTEENRRRSKRSDDYSRTSDKDFLNFKQSVDRRNPELKSMLNFLENKEKPGLNPHKYNQDGSLKTALNLPSFQKRYEEAKKARYIRYKDLKYRLNELSPREIFNP